MTEFARARSLNYASRKEGLVFLQFSACVTAVPGSVRFFV